MRWTWLAAISCCVTVGLVSVSPATVIRVPLEFPTIQAGINAAQDGDTVQVADGTYTGYWNRDIDLGGRAIVVMSESGPEVTIIDCGGSWGERHRAFRVCAGEDTASVIQGFTITNGYADNGGGIYCYFSSPTIRGNRITGNEAGNGGGIRCHYCSPTIVDNEITGNEAGNGGGIGCDFSSPMIVENHIVGNTADNGGGIHCHESSPTIAGSMLEGNTASGTGGGIHCLDHSSPTIDGSTITANGAWCGGGALHCDDHCSPTVVSSILWGNWAIGEEEIWLSGGSSITVSYSDLRGGWPGMGNIDADPEFVSADREDYRLLWGSPCIDSGHPDSLDPDGSRRDMGAHFFDQDDYLTLYLTPDTDHVPQESHLGVTYTLVNRWQQPESLWIVTVARLPSGELLDLFGPDPYVLPADTTVQQHLNHGVPQAAPLGKYVYRSRIGAPPSTIYDKDEIALEVVAPLRTWHVPDECPTIQAGIDSAAPRDTVLVADGVYTGDGNWDIDFGREPLVVRTENGPEMTTIDCEGGGEDSHRAFHFHSGEDSNSVVEGFTIKNAHSGGAINISCASPTIRGNVITGNPGGGIYCHKSSSVIAGNAITENSRTHGAGIYCDRCSATIEGNTISDNSAVYCGGGILCGGHCCPVIVGNTIARNSVWSMWKSVYGGGIYIDRSSPRIVDNAILENTADTFETPPYGGGIYCQGTDVGVSPVIVGNDIRGNTAGEGGGIYSYDSSPSIESNTIGGNTALNGGGIYCCESSPSIRGNVIVGNSIWGGWPDGGGGIVCWSSSPTVTQNTIVANTSPLRGGGVFCRLYSSPTLSNNVLWGNAAPAGPEIYVGYASAMTISYCDVAGGSSSVYVCPTCTLWCGEGNIAADPEFVLAEKEDHRLLWGSPCIDSGHPDSLDPDGTRSDMGAHYFDQDDYLTLYLTPDASEVQLGGQLGVTYTVINRWAQPEPFWVLTEVMLPSGDTLNVMGPDSHALPGDFTVQRYLTHEVPLGAPPGLYGYGSRIGLPPATLYDQDSFEFKVVKP